MPDAQVLEQPVTSAQEVTLVDCDIHPQPTSYDDLSGRLATRWQRHLERFGSRTPFLANYPRAVHHGLRGDIEEVNLTTARRQLLDAYGIDYGVLNYMYTYDREVPAFAADGARAINDWMVEEWMEPEPRLLGSIAVPFEYPELAVREIERRAAEPWWAQVLIPSEALEPLGSRKYWPIYEAATAHGLPIGMHFFGYDLHHGTGWPSYYFEEHTFQGALATRRQLLSMICEGLFEAVPEIRLALIEGGVAWVIALRWELDSAWELLREETSLTRRPSEYIDEHVWFSTQPIEEPGDPKQYLQMIEQGRLGNRLMFATDYPHWDFDSPTQALPRTLPPELRRQIMAGNACAMYELPRRRNGR